MFFSQKGEFPWVVPFGRNLYETPIRIRSHALHHGDISGLRRQLMRRDADCATRAGGPESLESPITSSARIHFISVSSAQAFFADHLRIIG